MSHPRSDRATDPGGLAYDPSNPGPVEVAIDRSAAHYGRHMAGVGHRSPYSARNVARINRAAVYAVSIDPKHNDRPASWTRLRAQADALLTLWSAYCTEDAR